MRRNRLTKHFNKDELSAMYATVLATETEKQWEAKRYAQRNCTKDEIASWLACILAGDFNKMIRDCLAEKNKINADKS